MMSSDPMWWKSGVNDSSKSGSALTTGGAYGVHWKARLTGPTSCNGLEMAS